VDRLADGLEFKDENSVQSFLKNNKANILTVFAASFATAGWLHLSSSSQEEDQVKQNNLVKTMGEQVLQMATSFIVAATTNPAIALTYEAFRNFKTVEARKRKTNVEKKKYAQGKKRREREVRMEKTVTSEVSQTKEVDLFHDLDANLKRGLDPLEEISNEKSLLRHAVDRRKYKTISKLLSHLQSTPKWLNDEARKTKRGSPLKKAILGGKRNRPFYVFVSFEYGADLPKTSNNVIVCDTTKCKSEKDILEFIHKNSKKIKGRKNITVYFHQHGRRGEVNFDDKHKALLHIISPHHKRGYKVTEGVLTGVVSKIRSISESAKIDLHLQTCNSDFYHTRVNFPVYLYTSELSKVHSRYNFWNFVENFESNILNQSKFYRKFAVDFPFDKEFKLFGIREKSDKVILPICNEEMDLVLKKGFTTLDEVRYLVKSRVDKIFDHYGIKTEKQIEISNEEVSDAIYAYMVSMAVNIDDEPQLKYPLRTAISYCGKAGLLNKMMFRLKNFSSNLLYMFWSEGYFEEFEFMMDEFFNQDKVDLGQFKKVLFDSRYGANENILEDLVNNGKIDLLIKYLRKADEKQPGFFKDYVTDCSMGLSIKDINKQKRDISIAGVLFVHPEKLEDFRLMIENAKEIGCLKDILLSSFLRVGNFNSMIGKMVIDGGPKLTSIVLPHLENLDEKDRRDVYFSRDSEGASAFVYSAHVGNVGFCKKALESIGNNLEIVKKYVNRKDKTNGVNALYTSCYQGSHAITSLILNKLDGINPDLARKSILKFSNHKDGSSPFYGASIGGNVKCMEVIADFSKKQGNDFFSEVMLCVNDQKNNPLMFSMINGRTQAVKLLLDWAVELNDEIPGFFNKFVGQANANNRSPITVVDYWKKKGNQGEKTMVELIKQSAIEVVDLDPKIANQIGLKKSKPKPRPSGAHISRDEIKKGYHPEL
jgi:hypothetical protein